jgi:1,4-dihydroxy-2-naphthoate octaprenyltransferase
MLGFGPVIVLGAHYVQQQALSADTPWMPLAALLASVPLALLVGLILFINGFQDYQADRAVGKRTLVVRTAEGGTIADYRKPFAIYTAVMLLTFGYIFALGLAAPATDGIGTRWIWLALLPSVLAYLAIRKGRQWLKRWYSDDADRRKLPYQLLPVNVLTIVTHLAVGLLLTLAFLIARHS